MASGTGANAAELAVLFNAIDATRAAAEYVRAASSTPDAFVASDFLGIGRFGRKVLRRAEQEPSALVVSTAMTACRTCATALDELLAVVPDVRLAAVAALAPHWPDQVNEGLGVEVQARLDETMALLSEYRRRADLGRPLVAEG